MMDDIENLWQLVKKISAEQNYSHPDIKVLPISTGGANFSSKLYQITVGSDGKHDLRMFAKIAIMAEETRKQFVTKPFDSERLFYTTLMKEYRDLEEKFNLLDRHKLAVPEYYCADATHLQEILVLEDLTSQGFTSHNRKESVSWQYAVAAIAELAKFHALSLAFQHNKPSEFDKIVKMLPKGMFTEHEGNHMYYNSSAKSAMAAVREENKEKLQRFLDDMSLSKFCNWYGAIHRPVVIHADFKPSNMLHISKKDGTIEVMVIDFQMIQAGSPVIDLLYFIFTATDGQFRARHYQDLIDYYHRELGAALERLGLDVEVEYSRKDFEFELKEKLSYGLHLSILGLPILLIDQNDAPELDSEFNTAKLAIESSGDLYVRRLNEVVDNYVTWGILI